MALRSDLDKKEKQEAISMCQDIVENYKEADVNQNHAYKKQADGGLFAQLDTSIAEREMKNEATEAKQLQN